MQEMERQCQQGLLCIRPSTAHYCATADSLRKQRGEKQGVRAAITALAASESFSPPPFPRHQQLAWHGRSCPRRQQPPGRTRRWPAAEARRSHRTYSSWRGHENPSSSGTRRGPGRARRLRGRLVGGALRLKDRRPCPPPEGSLGVADGAAARRPRRRRLLPRPPAAATTPGNVEGPLRRTQPQQEMRQHCGCLGRRPSC